MAYPNIIAATPNKATRLVANLPAAWSFDQSFTVNNAVGWSEVDATGSQTTIPLGQSGPFVLQLDAEQILCSSLIGNTVYVYQDNAGNGRAYNSTSAALHLAGVKDVILVGTSAQSITEGAPVASVFARTGAVVAGNADYLAVSTGGLTGAVSATRFVGGTATVAPTTGTFAVGDFVVTQNGTVLICTVAGTPGTWTNAAGSNASASGTVTGADAFGAAPAAGAAATFSKGDHDHGLPADPTADLRATTGATTLIYPEQHATAGAPSYVKGAIYFDTTLNKLRVGGATAWETITSV